MSGKVVLRLGLACLLCSSLFSCTTINSSPLSELVASEGKNQAYRIGVGDLINVSVWGEPKLSGDVVVRKDGKVSLPLINEVQAENRTLAEINIEVTQKLSSFVSDPSVVVTITQSAPTKYYLEGGFGAPGEHLSDTKISLLQAIAAGGGFSPFADKSKILLLRKTTDGERRYILNYDDVRAGYQPNPLLKTGDLISVQ